MKLKLILIIFLIAALNGCVVITEMIRVKNPTPSFDPSDIVSFDKNNFLAEEKIGLDFFYVKGFDEPHTPPNVEPSEDLKAFLMETQNTIDLNRSRIIRVYNNTNPNLQQVIILIPGLNGGGSTMVPLAKGIVRRLHESEVWIWERRANQLEDRRIIIKALTENDPSILTGLFKKDQFQLIDEKKAFYKPAAEDISFVGYWGVNVNIQDLFFVVKEARKKAKEVILGGFSLGALYAGVFLSNEFGNENESIPGYTLVDKVVFFDGPPFTNGYINSEFIYKQGAYLFPASFINGIDKIRTGKYYPANANPTDFFIIEAKAVLALLAPDALSPEPYTADDKKLPITNRAKFLIMFDDNYQTYKLFTATLGKANAKHTGKFGENTTVKITGLEENSDRISWILREKNDKKEFNNGDEYIASSVPIYSNMAEWYQSSEILLDFGIIRKNDTENGWQKKYFELNQTHNIDIPVLSIGFAMGLMQTKKRYLEYEKLIQSKDFTIIMIDEYTHLDETTVTDNGTRQISADIAANWLKGADLFKKDAENYKEAFFKK
ncbi:hypothetical protein JXB41_07350 [Candidatus Woesearchaeota archaeon]|nr:hypothetical protein [Candidatus Woesearchaeota archaeon]